MKKGIALKCTIGSLILAAVFCLNLTGGAAVAFRGPEQIQQEDTVNIPVVTTIVIESAHITETGTAEPVFTTETITPEQTPSPTPALSTPTQTALGILPLLSLAVASLLMYNRSKK